MSRLQVDFSQGWLKSITSLATLSKNKNSAIGAYIKGHFLAYDGKTKAIPIIADNSMAILKFGHTRCHFKRKLTENEKKYSFYMRKVMESQLIAEPQSPQECAALIDKNKGCLQEIKSIFSERRKKDLKDEMINEGASVVRPLASSLCKFVIKPDDPTYEQAISDIQLLFKVHKWAENYSVHGKSQALGYKEAISILNHRIDYLQEILHQYHSVALSSV